MAPRFTSTLACALALVISAAALLGAAPPMQTIVVAADDWFGVPEDVLAQAEHATTHVYASIGIALEWVDATAGTEADGAAPDLTVRVASPDMIDTTSIAREAVGAAPRSPTQYRTAYVFYDRVLKLTRPGHSDPADLLGFVMAHEIGHLLLPVGAHAPTGIMRSHWTVRDVEPTKNSLLKFSDDEASLIRARAGTLAQRAHAAEPHPTTP